MKFVIFVIISCIPASFCQFDPIVNIEENKKVLERKFQFPYAKLIVRRLAAVISKNLQVEETHSQGPENVKWMKELMNFDEVQKISTENRGKAEDEDGFVQQTQVSLEKPLGNGDDSVSGDETEASDTCLNDTQTVLNGIQQGENWALEMLDAFGKPGSDILRGNFGWLGSYDECLNVTTPQTDSNFRSTYCRTTLTTPMEANQSMQVQMASQLMVITIGMCLPDTCSNRDVTNIIVDVLNNTNISLTPTVSCYIRDYSLDTDAIVAIVICSVFAFLVIIGTGCDVIFIQEFKANNSSTTKPSPRYNYGSTSSNVHTAQDEKTPLVSESDLAEEGKTTDMKSNLEQRDQTVEKKTVQSGLGYQLLLSFSAYTNCAKILNTKQATGSLTAVHGVRFLSMTWVMLGHVYSTLPNFGTNLLPYFEHHIKSWEFSAILNGLLSVDSFFTLSGLLVSYLTLREMKKGGGKLNWVMFYFHRFWRLTPVYMIMLMVFNCLFHYFGDGPFWYQTGIQKETCSDYWWTNLLYINNLVHRENQCFSWGWYLANDMQFYVLSPLILIPLFFSELFGMIVLGIFLAATMTTAGLISRLNNLQAGFLYMVEGMPGPDTYMDYYMTPYCRMGPYLVGMAAGYILYKHNEKIRMGKIKALIGWMIAAASALAVVYGPYESANGTPMSSDVGALYNAVHRSVWGAAVSWVVVACATGNGGFVNTLLSWSGFVPLSRLTYTIYLIHPMVISLLYMSQRSFIYLTDLTIVCNFLGILVASYMIALIVSLTFEAPMMGLERALLKRERRT